MVDRSGRSGRLFDGVILLLAAAPAGWLMWRTVPDELHEWPATLPAKLAVYGGAVCVVLLLLLIARILRGAPRVVFRVAALCVVGLLAFGVKVRTGPKIAYAWPPESVGDWAAIQRSMKKPAERAEFGARVLMHRLDWLRDANGAPVPATHADSLAIPAAWLFPDSVTVAIERGGGDTVRVWARADTVVRCAEVPQPAVSHDAAHKLPTRGANETQELVPCAGRKAPPASAFVRPTRVADATAPIAFPPSIGSGWPQYRLDAAHTATVADAGVSADAASAGDETSKTVAPADVASDSSWAATIEGEVRSSASIVGDLVLVGTHGNGELAAFDRRSGALRWRRRLPNWVHQDPVSDGRVVVVGFGDNSNGFAGQSPSGVVAYAAGNGTPLWTVFDESSVMTSPIITGDALVYASATGRLRKRRLLDGALVADSAMPGGVIMGPPAAVGDTAVVALDSHALCAVLMSSFTRLWCRDFPHTILMGHYAPTVVNGVVYAAGSVVFPGMSWREFRMLPFGTQFTALRAVLRPRFLPLGQRLWALNLRDGAVLWAGPMHVDTKPIGGHPAGTAVVQGTYGTIMYPQQDTLAGFDTRTGAELWRTDGGGTRAALLLVDSLVIHAERDGTMVSRSLVTGAVRCSVKLPAGFDRAGPVRIGNTIVSVDRTGGVRTFPVSRLTHCPAA